MVAPFGQEPKVDVCALFQQRQQRIGTLRSHARTQSISATRDDVDTLFSAQTLYAIDRCLTNEAVVCVVEDGRERVEHSQMTEAHALERGTPATCYGADAVDRDIGHRDVGGEATLANDDPGDAKDCICTVLLSGDQQSVPCAVETRCCGVSLVNRPAFGIQSTESNVVGLD